MKTSRFAQLMSLVLCFCMILGMLPVSAFATENQEPAADAQETHTHTGGTATCTELAVCECGEAYGELAAHTPSEDDGDCTTAILCAVCGGVTTAAAEAHTPNEDGTACSVCGKALTVHTHTGGTATCEKLAVCECGEAYGELAGHTPSEDGTVCTVCNAVLVEEKPDETEPVSTETVPDESESEGDATGVITAWSWIDAYEVIDPKTNTFTVISASENNRISASAVANVLPASILATVDGVETVVELAGWSCDGYPKAGAYYGNWTFKAALPEGVVLGEGTKALEVNVFFDESAGDYVADSKGGIAYNINSSASTDNYYNLISKKDWEIAPGIYESQIVLNNEDGSYRQVLFVMEADLSNEHVKVINSYTGMIPKYGSYTVGGMTKQAALAEEMGYGNVVGAMNTTLSWYTNYPAERVGEPLGFIMLDAEILFDPANCGYTYGNVGFPSVLVINKDFDEDGNPRPANIPKVEMPQIKSAADLDGWEDQVIPCSSGYILKDGVNQTATAKHNDPAPRSVVGIKPDGTVVIMVNDGRQSPYSAGMNMYELAEVMLDLGCTYAVNCDGGGSTTWVSQRPGEELKINNSPSDGGERSTTTGILFISTAPADGEFYRAHISTEDVYYTPNSTVQFDAIGTDMGGTEVEIPADVQWRLSDDSFGEIDNNGLFTSNGKEGSVTAQIVYNGGVVGEASITIVLPDIAFKQETIVIGYGDSMMLPIDVTTNEGRNTVTYKPGDIVYTLSDEALGTIDGDQFTACDGSSGLTEGTITAVICGQEEKTITASIRFGKASELVYDFEDGELIVDNSKTGNIGGDDAEDTGEYIYGWHINDTRANGYYSYRTYTQKAYTPIGMDIPTKLYLVDRSNGMVRNGNYAMAVDIDWTNVTASCHGQMDLALPEPLDLTDATRVGFWLYIPRELITASMQVSAGFKGSRVDYKLPDYLKSDSGINNGGWYYFSWDVLDTYKSLDYIQINSHYTAGEGKYNYYQDVTFYIDDITVDYSDATIDRENPYFTSMTIADEYTSGVEVSGQTITTNTITLMAQAYENTTKTNATGLNLGSVKLYVDGVRKTGNIAASAGGTISVSDLYLNDGVHTLVMEISDNQGNVGNIVRKIVVNTEKSAVRLEVPAPEVDLLPTGSIYWVNLVADDLASIDSVTTTISLDYVNDWELEGMEVAYGFSARYSINNHNDAVITFTRTGAEVADTTILAKLPVRIWMAKGWMDASGIRKDYISNDPAKQDKYYILTPHAMWYSDGTRDYRLVVGAEAGSVTYVDGSTMTFSAKDTVIQTEMNRYYTNADRQGKWSFHICTPGTAQSKAPTCTESGYENRVFCVACACGTVENLSSECDTHNGCGSVISWGKVLPAEGHKWEINAEGKLACANNPEELFSGVYEGKEYVDGEIIADGWMEVEGVKTYYYKDGVKLTGSHMLEGTMCTFDENGVYLPDYQFEGFYEVGNTVMYFIANKQSTGYNRINSKPYYFDKNGLGYEGEYTINGDICVFDNGTFVSCENPEVEQAGWAGDTVEYVVYKNGKLLLTGEGATDNFGGKLVPWTEYCKQFIKSIHVDKGITYLGGMVLRNCFVATSLTFAEDSQLKTISNQAIQNLRQVREIVLPESVETLKALAFGHCYELKEVYIPAGVTSIHANTFSNHNENLILSVAAGSYAEEYAKENNIGYTSRAYVAKNGVYNIDGVNYYFVNDVKTNAGLVEVDGFYYYASTGGVCKTGKYWVSRTNDLLPEGFYFFDEQTGRMDIKNGVYAEDGALYYYVNGARTSAGLVLVDGKYYYTSSGGQCKTGKYWVSRTNGLLTEGYYFFDEVTAAMIIKNGIYAEDGAVYYYLNGARTSAGLVKVDGFYYYASSGGQCKTGKYWVSRTNNLLPEGYYFFDEQTGRMDIKNGVYEEDGGFYYYVDGARTNAGLIKVGENYYYASSGGQCKTGKYWVSRPNGLMAAGYYTFGEDSKMIR